MGAIQGIGEKLTQLRERDPQLWVTDANWHKYQLSPPLSEEVIANWEAPAEIRLPEEYRLFLRELGEGPARPGFGMRKLTEMNLTPDLKEPFPLVEPFLGLGSIDTSKLDREQEWEAYKKFLAQWEKIPDGGILSLTHYGCDIYGGLVLNGKYRGQIWIWESNSPSYSPFGYSVHLHDPDQELRADSPKHFTFFQWYEHWLDGALKEFTSITEYNS
jgi:hypothetical protein